MQSRNPAVNLKGIDISHNNGTIDFVKVKRSGISAVIEKMSEGSTMTDNMGKSNVLNAQAAGLKVGFYHFLHVYKNSTIDAQVTNFIRAIDCLKPDCLLAVDIETGGYHDNLDAKTVTAQVLQFADKVKAATGIEVILYSNTDFIKCNLTSDICRLRAWIAQITSGNAPTENGKYTSWVGFQYSWTGKIDGISCNVDVDEFTSDILIKQTSVQYQGHVQSIGWQNPVKDGSVCGTVGQALRLEALKISLLNVPAGLRVKYRGHVQGTGWQDWLYDGAEAGTEGKSLRLEAIQIGLEGTNADRYSIVYQAHVQSIGWQPEVKDGAIAGTTGKSLRMEAIKIRIARK